MLIGLEKYPFILKKSYFAKLFTSVQAEWPCRQIVDRYKTVLLLQSIFYEKQTATSFLPDVIRGFVQLNGPNDMPG